MSKISNEGLEQIKVIKNALDSMYDKLGGDFYLKSDKKVKDIEKQFVKTNVFQAVQNAFEAISNIVSDTDQWETV